MGKNYMRANKNKINLTDCGLQEQRCKSVFP